jgi:hypothetical protein
MLVSILNIDNNIKELIQGPQRCNTIQILIFDGYVKVRICVFELLYG